MRLFTETELQLRLLIHPKAILCTLYSHKFIPPIPACPWSQLRIFVKKFSLPLVCCQVWCIHLACWAKQLLRTLSSLIILVPDTILPSFPVPLSWLTSPLSFFKSCSVFHPSTSFSFLLALAPAWIPILPKPWIMLSSSPSSLNLYGSPSSPYCRSSCSYTDSSNFMVVSPPCAMSGTTSPLLKTSVAFL